MKVHHRDSIDNAVGADTRRVVRLARAGDAGTKETDEAAK